MVFTYDARTLRLMLIKYSNYINRLPDKRSFMHIKGMKPNHYLDKHLIYEFTKLCKAQLMRIKKSNLHRKKKISSIK